MPRAEAEKVWKALEGLYRDDPTAEPILHEVARSGLTTAAMLPN